VPEPLRVTLWNEFIHERKDDSVRAIYPDGMHAVWEQALHTHLGDAVSVRSAWLEQPDNGLPGDVLESTDVLFWWGHIAHDRVADPVARGVPSPIVIPEQEMYGEFFDVPPPDDLVFISSFSGGEVFRGGCGWKRGFGRVFYFSPGDQEYPVYHHPDVQRVLANAVTWAAPADRMRPHGAPDAPNAPRGWFEA